ncbi:MAG: ABC transporter substrate-binding protein [Rhodospirillales bacterium]|nr:ABC transporter substrate-binding protein [Rhodospirillales bacterium]MBT4041350.1 ABC transporter substrate-binding protein [Rhodospirillales bacterium]MBT4626274.1 ABC transporter substrate-binding protein [Rhodospirillales bacterium]MBT5353058.1 ABC transporter substrate-binding protein [Rhodospirillales bacterium]MBT5520536.1 ABC transporter substrate-binding protein [Rhodospirillales bacterium]
MLSDGVADRETALKIASLQSGFESGSIDRRGFMTGAAALGVGLVAATSFVSEVQAATPKKGGRMRTALTGGATSDTLDPGQILDLYMLVVQFGQARNNLTEVDANGELVGELAESWEASADASEWNFNIRKGIEFTNGKTLDANDVAASLNHHLGEDSTSAAKGILNGVESVKTDGKNNVVVKLSGGDADFPYILSDYHLLMCPANDDGTIDWQSGIGTGSYSITEHDPGVRTLSTRNPNYWKENSAYFDEVEVFQVADATARTSGLQSGEFDAMNNVAHKTVHLLDKAPGINVHSVTGNKQITLPMRTDTAPYDNNDVRMAVKHIVDREQWLKLILRGNGELGNDNPIGPANFYRATTDELPQRAYDPEKAKHHLKKAGMDGLKIQFHAAETGFGGAVDAGQLMRESARAAGIDVEVIREPNDGYWSNVWMKKAFSACYWSGRPTENWMFSQVYAADASWNDTYWKHDRFNELLIMGRAELDQTKRRDIYVEMQQIVNMEGGVCLPLFAADLMAVSDKVGMQDNIGNNWELDGAHFGERWWFA